MVQGSLTSGSAFANASAELLQRPIHLLFAVALVIAAVACGGDATASGTPVSTITITPPSIVLTPGTARALTASAVDEGGAAVSGDVHWSTESQAVATVNSQGVVTGIAPGRTQVAASIRGVSAVAPITVSPLPAALVRVNPTSVTVRVSATTTLTAEVLDAGGTRMGGQVISWSSANSSIATVSSAGVVSGVGAGTVVITAAASGLSGTAVVTVQPTPVSSVSVAPSSATVNVGNTIQLTAEVRDAAGNTLTGRVITWTSGNIAKAVVLPGGLVTGVSKGSVTISASVDGKTGSSSVTVR
jgi:uncharacterized protein YjdB